jgi:hypothetical protein
MPRIPPAALKPKPAAASADLLGGDFLDKIIRVIEGFEKIMATSGRAETMVQGLLPAPKPDNDIKRGQEGNAAAPAHFQPSPNIDANAAGAAAPAHTEKKVNSMDKQTIAAHVAAAVDGVNLAELLDEVKGSIPAEYANMSVSDLLAKLDSLNPMMRSMLETYAKRKIAERLVAQVLNG